MRYSVEFRLWKRHQPERLWQSFGGTVSFDRAKDWADALFELDPIQEVRVVTGYCTEVYSQSAEDVVPDT